MKYSYKWLKEISGTTKNPQELGQLLMLHAFEVENIEESKDQLEGVVVGELLEVAKHPNADKLQLTKVKIGKEILDVVCGAKNIAVGDKVPVALVGTKLPNGLEIKAAEIRGEKSQGMLCAEDELGLGSSHEGILQLEKNLEIGTPLAEILELDDVSLEIDILANRAHDALSHVGMGREIAALEGREIDYDYAGLVLDKKTAKNLSVKIADKQICSRYIGAVLEKVQVGDSPQWLKNRLKLAGIRPINNVVDTTNYVMLEIGQPLHAFDFEKIASKEKVAIEVRRAQEGEELAILDGSVKKLTNQDLVIANAEKAIALAGVMGGLESGVTAKTSTIVLEAANFAPAMIRRTRMGLGLASDAALRFEKELDPNIAEKAMVRAIEILEHIAGAEYVGKVDEYLVKKNPTSIKLDLAYVKKLLGIEIPAKESKKILNALGIKTAGLGEIIKAEIPTYRLDLVTQEDLIEEIGRIYGYEKIVSCPPLVSVAPAAVNEKRIFARNVKNILAGMGFYETYNYSFYGVKDAQNIGLKAEAHLQLESPMNPEQALMRMSLVPGILKNIQENLKNQKEFEIFELGKVYLPTNQVLPQEKDKLVGAVMLEQASSKAGKNDLRQVSNFFQAKALLNKLLVQLGINDQYYVELSLVKTENSQDLWHKTRSAEIKITGSGEVIGFVGEINPKVAKNFGVGQRVVLFDLDMEKLLEISQAEREFRPIGKYPVVTRDISMVVGKKVKVDDILRVMQKAGGDLLLDADLFDAIDFADNTSSFAFRLTLGAEQQTLTGKQVEDVMTSIMQTLEAELKVTLRK